MSVETLPRNRYEIWRESAYCKGLPVEETHGPDGETGNQRNAREKRIIGAYCFRCTVKKQCLDDALGLKDEFGVRGGTAECDRQRYFDGELTQKEMVLRGALKVYGAEALEQLAELPVQRQPAEPAQPANSAA